MVSGGRQPTYDDLNVNQCVQGIIKCAVEESNEVIRQNMLNMSVWWCVSVRKVPFFLNYFPLTQYLQ